MSYPVKPKHTENLRVIISFLRALIPADNGAFAKAQVGVFSDMINDVITELDAQQKRVGVGQYIDELKEEVKKQRQRVEHLEQYKAGWVSVINACNDCYPNWAPFSESDYLRVADLIKSVSADPVGFHARDAILGGKNEYFKRRYAGHGRRVLFIQKKDTAEICLRQVIATQALQALIIAGLNTDAWENYADLSASAYAIADEFLTTGKSSDPMQESYFSRKEIDLFRQWFNAIEDTNRAFLKDADNAAYHKILSFLEDSATKGGAQ